jgi:hypothetical protein
MKISRRIRFALANCVLISLTGCAHTVRVKVADSAIQMPVGNVLIRCDDVRKDLLLGVGTNSWNLISDSAGEAQIRGKWTVHLEVTRHGYSLVLALYAPRKKSISVLAGPQHGQLLTRTNGYITLLMDEVR